ncbi:NifB/NifX family molybdenum-iron cluster-binding protein [Roseimarinus sediminis]|uniref:NifB/NifX family molybdenum-iron cluster-binding protein n=1 Tax=Roseimarinus sediminis TaxID=1610899 RepID=UPI003D1C2A2D
MKLAIPVTGTQLENGLSLKFARSKYFALIEKETHQIEWVENPYFDEDKKVGEHVFSWLTSGLGVDTLLAFELGLKVQQLASASNLQLIIISEKKRTLKQLLRLMQLE